MRSINTLVVHCSASHQNATVDDIRRWHVDERGWSDIGYHYVISADGVIHKGRPVERAGAHVRKRNHDSIGVCWIGGYKGIDNRTDAQRLALRHLITELLVEHEIDLEEIKGHRDFDGVKKSCPNFDVQKWYFNEQS